MRKIFLTLAIFSLTFSPLHAAENFVKFPAIGECTGTFVRYREAPNTGAEILGRLNKPDKTIVLGNTFVNGDVWYEMETPDTDSRAWIFGKYIVPAFTEEEQNNEIYSLIVNILQNYGITESKADLYSGPQGKAIYKNNFLVYLEVWQAGNSFGDISIGDSENKLTEILGYPKEKNNYEWEYYLNDNTVLTFRVKNGRITRMIFEG